MVVRLGAAVLFTGLAFAAPSLAETPILESSYSLDLREDEGPALLSLDRRDPADIILAGLSDVDVPGPLTDLPLQAVVDWAPAGDPVLAQLSIPDLPAVALEADFGAVLNGPSEPLLVALAEPPPAPPAFVAESTDLTIFASREESENFSWMVADLADAENLTTGSISLETEFQSVPEGPAEGVGASSGIVNPLTDDALRALELSAP